MNRTDLKNLVYMQIAKTLSQLSTCNRLKVGAVLLGYDGSVVGTGYNGSLPVPSTMGWDLDSRAHALR